MVVSEERVIIMYRSMCNNVHFNNNIKLTEAQEIDNNIQSRMLIAFNLSRDEVEVSLPALHQLLSDDLFTNTVSSVREDGRIGYVMKPYGALFASL